MTRQTFEAEAVAANMNIVETAVVSVLTSLGIATGFLGMALVWDAVGTIAFAGHTLAVGFGIGLAIGLPVLLARLGRTAVRRIPTRRRGTSLDARTETTR